MGQKFTLWEGRSNERPSTTIRMADLIRTLRQFEPVDRLEYGDYGLERTINTVRKAIEHNRRIALYADYDVDGTMSAVSWIWFFRAIGYSNFLHYIPCRFKEGYGLNLGAMQHLIENEGAQLIITMDTGITANQEAAYCQSRGVDFICTDHHKIQPDKMPDCIILNPKMHPDHRYQELCGCGITFVLLRRLGEFYQIGADVWQDLLALAGIATICDIVPLNGVNHKLARLGIQALMRSQRKVLRQLRTATAMQEGADEKDIGFRVGPRINAVGRLEHADAVIKAFVDEDASELIAYMEECNERRKVIQKNIVREAMQQAALCADDPILFLGGDWHPGVVGIAASKLAETFWKPTWLFQRHEGGCKGSARAIAGFDVTEAMTAAARLFAKFGGHRAAGGFSFPIEAEEDIKRILIDYAATLRHQSPETWISRLSYDCELDTQLCGIDLVSCLEDMKPFGHGFDEPKFLVRCKLAQLKHYLDKTTGEARHTALFFHTPQAKLQKIMFFNDVIPPLAPGTDIECVVTAGKNTFRGVTSMELYGVDWIVRDI